MDDDTLDCAKGFVRKLEDFEFVFMLYTYEQIFSETDVVFDIVQQRAMDVLYCKKRIESHLAFVKEKRSEGAFQAVYAKTDLTSDPRDKPMRKRRLTQLQDPQERYRNLYMAILDNILEQIPRCFSNLESMLFLELANPEKFDDMRQVFPEEAFQSVLKSYGHHFDSGRLRSELQVLYSDQDLQGLKMRTISEIMMLAMLYIVSNVGLAFASESPSSSILTTFSWNCTNICNSGSCSYPLLPQMYPDSRHEDCEAAVYTLDELLLAHSSLSANPTNLSTMYCMDKLLLKITCTNPYYQYQALYRVTNVSRVSAATLASTHS
ncbi:Zinc finger MYM-type protein 1, partial [Clarias magur]